MMVKQLFRERISRNSLIAISYILLVLVVGFMLADDYGQGWDDAADAFYGREVSQAYEGSDEYYKYEELSHYGPFYYLFQYQLTKKLSQVLGEWKIVHLRYLVNFLVFQLGVISLYLIAIRLFSKLTAVGLSLLFFTQPLLFGHAFINHKDGVFLSFFLLTVALGFWMVDELYNKQFKKEKEGSTKQRYPSINQFIQSMRSDYRMAHRLSRIILLAILPVLLMVILELIGKGVVRGQLYRLIGSAYYGESLSMINALFTKLATNRDTIPLVSYLRKFDQTYTRFMCITLAFSIATVFLVIIRISPTLKKMLGDPPIMAISAAGISLGILTAIRIAGPFAGLLVLLFYLLKTKNLRSTGSLMLYLFIAYLTTYIFWPALWRAPLKHLINTFHMMSQFPAHDVLYLGTTFSSQELPWHFFPRLIFIQLTEPALILFTLAIISFFFIKKARENFCTPEMIVIMVWFTVPFAGVVFLGLPSYGNFRHYLFSLPPIFIIGGVGLDWLLKLTRRLTLRIGLVILLLIPGMISLVQLHPYEYIYYNSLVGGVKGAEGYYELDYWCTSYREAVEYVNQNAPSASRVVVWGPTATAQTFARSDLLIMTEAEVEETPDYALACHHALYNSDYYATFGTLHEVKVMGATISRLKIAIENE